MRLFSNRSQRMSKCGKNISETLGCASCATFLFLPHFDLICDLPVLLNRRTATWNLFVKVLTLQTKYRTNNHQVCLLNNKKQCLEFSQARDLGSASRAVLCMFPKVRKEFVKKGAKRFVYISNSSFYGCIINGLCVTVLYK